MIIKMALWPHMNILLDFSCGRKGSEPLFHVTLPNMYPNHCNRKQWNVPKMMLNRDIDIWNFIFLFKGQKNLQLILLLIGNSLIYVKLLFLSSFLLDKLICDSSSCRGMIYYLHFRRCISDVHVPFIWQVEPVVDFILGGGYIWIWTHHLKIWIDIWCPCALHMTLEGISESVHFIWKYELISDVHVHFIWHWRVYLNLYTSSENMNSYLMSMYTSSCSLHLIPGEVYLISAFTSSEKLTVTTHIMNSWTLNNLCRLLCCCHCGYFFIFLLLCLFFYL